MPLAIHVPDDALLRLRGLCDGPWTRYDQAWQEDARGTVNRMPTLGIYRQTSARLTCFGIRFSERVVYMTLFIWPPA